MLQKNTLLAGLLSGLAAPLLAMLFTEVWTFSLRQPHTWYVLAALANLLLLRFHYRNGREQAARGVILVTFVAMLSLLWVRS
jgi:hypothetical protein